jgi:hypothetical protein
MVAYHFLSPRTATAAVWMQINKLNVDPVRAKSIAGVLNGKKKKKIDEGFQKGINKEKCVFYLVQPFPDILPNRVKLGITGNVETRLKSFSTICPEVKMVNYWACLPAYEQMIMTVVTSNAKKIGKEVFDVPCVKDLEKRLNIFFNGFL